MKDIDDRIKRTMRERERERERERSEDAGSLESKGRRPGQFGYPTSTRVAVDEPNWSLGDVELDGRRPRALFQRSDRFPSASN